MRGSYHLYQGLGGFVGNAAMGAAVRLALHPLGAGDPPLVIAHTILDVFAFVGYALLAGHVSWLPG